MKTYAYGLNNYNDEDIINDDTASDYVDRRELDFLETYQKSVDFYPSNEVSLSDKIFDMTVAISLNKILTLGDYFSLFQSDDSKFKKLFGSKQKYYIPNFSNDLDTDVYYQYNFKLKGNNPSIIGPYTLLKFSNDLDDKSIEKYMNILLPIYVHMVKNYKVVHIEEPAFSNTKLSFFDINFINKFYEKLTKDIYTKINVFTYGPESCGWLLGLDVNGIGMDINNEDNFDTIISLGNIDKTLFAGLIGDERDINFDKIKQLNECVNDLYICNYKPLSDYKDYTKVLDNLKQIGDITDEQH